MYLPLFTSHDVNNIKGKVHVSLIIQFLQTWEDQ